MRFGILLAPETPWEALLDLARHAESSGWDSLWYADHFMPPAGDLTAPMGESWTTIAALAAAVPRIGLGHMVSCNTYRHPALVAKMAVTVDRVSGGRFVLGLGAGWQENEHRAYGIAFGTTAERHQRLDESCEIIRGLLSRPRTTFLGRHYRIEDAPLEPKPLRQPLPLLVGAGGERLGLRIVARHADWWNTGGLPEVIQRKMAILDRHCADVGRDPNEIRRTAFALFVHTDDRAQTDWYGSQMPENRGALPIIAGGGREIADGMRRYRELGIAELVTADLTLGVTTDEKKRGMDRLLSIGAAFRDG